MPFVTQNAAQLLQKFKAGQIIVASVESCTGGMIADQLTHISGISEHFWGSWVTYDNSSKLTLGVPTETLARYGAVSSETALSMAENGLKKLADVLQKTDPAMIHLIQPWKTLAVVSTTGVAGPGGGTPEAPVGLCYTGVAILKTGAAPITKFLKIQAPQGLGRVETKEHFAKLSLEFLLRSL